MISVELNVTSGNSVSQQIPIFANEFPQHLLLVAWMNVMLAGDFIFQPTDHTAIGRIKRSPKQWCQFFRWDLMATSGIFSLEQLLDFFFDDLVGHIPFYL